MFLIPVLLFYGLSNQVSVGVVESLIQKENFNQLTFVRGQLDLIANSLAMNAITLTRDPAILSVEKVGLANDEQRLAQTESNVEEKLLLQSSASSWYNDITLYFPGIGKTITTRQSAVPYDEAKLDRDSRNGGWLYSSNLDSKGESMFHYYAGGPIFEQSTVDQNIAIAEYTLYKHTFSSLLDQLKKGGKGDPFMVNGKGDVILNSTCDQSRSQAVAEALLRQPSKDGGSFQLSIQNDKYMVNYVYSQPLNFYITDYTPMQQILEPITTSRNLFYVAVMLLLALGITASFLLYRNVQLPLTLLKGALKRFQNGDFSIRVNRWFHNEFDFVLLRFNDMAEQIQDLIETVYEERGRSRLAELKQLQAQINPHFLYNSLNFIISSTNLGRKETVLTMAYNLSTYYRYTMRLENQSPSVREELELVRNYLEIHKLRLQRIDYNITIPDNMLDLELPRLLLQPIVENAIVHGLETKLGGGHITIYGRRVGGDVQLTVEDDGIGLSPEKLMLLEQQLELISEGDAGLGLRNVNRRLKHRYGKTAGLQLEALPGQAGLRVTMSWREEEGNDPIAACR